MDLETHSVLINTVLFLLGSLATFVGSYIKIIRQISYIKGQLNVLLKSKERIEEMATIKDLDKMVTRIDLLESKLLKGAAL